MSDDERTLHAMRVKQTHEAQLLAKANVLGVGVGLRPPDGESDESVAIVVLVRQKVPAAELAPADRIPPDLDGVPVEVMEVGDVRAGD